MKIKIVVVLSLLSKFCLGQIQTVENTFFGCEPASFKFYTIGNSHSGQTWSDGIGNTSTKDTATFLFSNAGTYIVTIGSLSQTITVYPQLAFNFTSDSAMSGCLPFKFNLKDATSYPTGIFATKINWTYENGGGKIGNPIYDEIASYYKYDCFVKMSVETNSPSCFGSVDIPKFFKILDKPIAKIVANPATSCKVPFTLNLNNLSIDSLKTDLNFLWKWNKPSAGTATDSIPNPINYSTNVSDFITLEVTNKLGCKSYDTIRVGIDTPSFNFNILGKVCIHDSGTLSIINGEVNDYSYSFSSAAYIKAKEVNDTLYKFIPNNRATGFYPITITKTSKNDPSCKISITKMAYLINDRPKVSIQQSSPCKTPIIDTIRVNRITANVDSIIYDIRYIDKYGINVEDSFYGDNKPNIITKYKTDSSLIFKLNKYDDIDSFYRKGPLNIFVIATFLNKETNCRLLDTVSASKSSIFRAHLMNYKNKGCLTMKDSFRVFTYGDNKIDSVYWHFGDNSIDATKKDTTRSHLYNTTGVYRAFAIAKNATGCIDTTNPVMVKRGDSITPQLTISQRNLCISDSTTFTINNSSQYDKWYFVTDSFKSFNCPNETSYTWKNFYHIGKQPVYLITEKNGCISTLKDSINIDGPKFNLDYDFKCSRRDSIKFYLKDTMKINALFYTWDFGDGTIINSSLDTLWHKYTGDSVDYKVKVTITNLMGCSSSDSTIVKIRKVKALFKDTIFCKQTLSDYILNGTPYFLNPNLSKNADYICNYRYTWSFESIAKPGFPAKKYPLYTYGDKIQVDIPLDTMNLSLIARDINGCEDTMTKRIIVTDNNIDFTLSHTGFCPPNSILQFTNLSSSVFGISDTTWEVYTLNAGVLGIPVLYKDTVQNFRYTVSSSVADSFRIFLKIKDSAGCKEKEKSIDFGFFKDTSSLYIPLRICQNTANQIKSSEDNINLYQYRWYINGSLTSDTLSSFGYKFNTLGKFRIRLVKTHRILGCIKIMEDTTLVLPKPKIRIDNTFDTLANKCFPAVTKISYYDSASISGVNYYFEHNGNRTNLNPTNITLNGGINPIQFVFWTDYGCRDTLINIDTVIKPSANLSLDKTMICKGDSIKFSLTNPTDIDTVHWIFGDGNENYGKNLIVTKSFPNANALSDTIYVNYVAYAPNKSCPFSRTIPIQVLEARASHYLNNGLDTSYCFDALTINNTSARADYFKWNFGDGKLDSSSKKLFTYRYQYPGTYIIKLYAYRKPLGCVDSSIRILNLYPKPKLTVKSDTICLGKSFDLVYSDTLPNTLIYLKPDFYKKNPYTQSPIKSFLLREQDTPITIISESIYKCRDTFKPKFLIIYPDTLRHLDTIIESGRKVVLPLKYNSTYKYNWSPPLNNPSCINCSSPELQVIVPTLYKLTITDINGCFTDTSHYFIDIYPEIKIEVPTAFTPNGDGNNDVVYARGYGVKKLISFKIFNRLGQLIFMTTDMNVGWDGYYKGIPQNTDSYYYTYEAEAFIPNKFVSGEGNFMLLR